ncbi:MAG: hypothetical protein H6555_02115 [Lewinellaceae bacterium]|nr:hypothetical protein [Lewinellaceae bacterium]
MRMPAGYRFLVLLLLAIAAPQLLGAQVKLNARLDSMDILIGDQVTLVLDFSHPATHHVVSLGLEAIPRDSSLEVVRIGRIDTLFNGNEIVMRQQVILTAFQQGDFQVGPIPLIYESSGRQDTAYFPAQPLRVRLIPVTADSTDIQPIKDIWREPVKFSDFLPWMIGIGALLALGLLFFWWWRQRQRPAAVDVQLPPRPAHEIALEKLAALENGGYLERRQFKTFQSELTFIFREYLEGRFGLAALELPSAQLLREMQRSATAPDWIERLRSWLTMADLVKFAKAEPPVSFHQESLHYVREFITETQAHPESTGAEQIDDTSIGDENTPSQTDDAITE